MGRERDPSSTRVEVKVHPRYDDGAVHPGRGPTPSQGRRHSPHSPRHRTSQLPPPRDPTRDRDFSLFKRWFPWMVPSFVVVNILLFLVSMYVNDCPKHSQSGSCVAPFLGRFSFQPLKENPLFGPSSSTLDKMGALKVDKVVHGHQVWRLFSCIWLHGGVIHVLANMLSLIFIGLRLEQEFGFGMVLVIIIALFQYWVSVT